MSTGNKYIGENMDYQYDPQAIDSAISDSQTLEYRFDFISPKDGVFIIKVLERILQKKSLIDISDELNYILMELITNANKANVKKIFFLQKEADLNNPGDYNNHLKDFSQAIQSGYESFIPYFSRFNLRTRVIFEFTEEYLWIRVANNRAATPEEVQRVQTVIRAAGQIRNTIEAFDKMTDRTEGANLGTLTSILMLRRIGLSSDDYFFESDAQNNETQVSLRIRLDTVTIQQADRISEVIASSIDKLPGFPENIVRLQKMMADENVDFSKVAEVIQSDPALTADLLKIVNSAQYMLPQKVSNLTNALSLIGIRGIKNLLYSFGAQQIFQKNFGRFEELWEHAYQTGSYAYNLAKELKLKNAWDDVYLGGVLHDMGKILIYQVSSHLLSAIKEHCGGRIGAETMLETLAIGASHARIGANTAARWNFPDFLIDLIRYHHTPLLAPDSEKEKALIVYLADILYYIGEGIYGYDSIQDEVLQYLNISRESLPGLELRLRSLYQDQKKKMDL